MVDTGIAIFAYNRSGHLKKVLDGLRKNEISHNVYIFQDGMKNSEDLNGHNAVKEIISAIDWMEFDYVYSIENKGCAKSIEDGISYVLGRHDAVIILEDDCVPLPYFFNYMDACLEKYKENEKVIGIGGFAWNLDMNIDAIKEDVYASGRTSSWGWGTWKDRWKGYKRDYEILRRLYFDQMASERLGIWGDDFEDVLCAELTCRVDAWDVFWALHTVEKDKVFILPYKSLVENIGTDGTGTHCSKTDSFIPRYYWDGAKDFRLIDNCEPTLEIKMAFAPLWNGYGHYMEYNNADYKKAILWGIGNYYRRNKKNVLKEYDVQAFIDKKKIRYFEGKPVIDCSLIHEYEYEYIVIMFSNKEEAVRMKQQLIIIYKIPEHRIIVWQEEGV